MRNEITKIVDRIFAEEFYSENVNIAKEKVTLAVQAEYDQLIAAQYNDVQAIGILMSKYGTVEKAGELAGYTKEEISSWNQNKAVWIKKDIVKRFRKVRYAIYVGSIGFTFMMAALINLIIFRNLFWSVQLIVYTLSTIFCGWFICKKRKEFLYKSICLDISGVDYLKRHLDQYFKRMMNSYYIFIVGFAFLIYLICIFVLKMGMSWNEVFTSIYSAIAVIELVIYMVIKNTVCTWWLSGGFQNRKRRELIIYGGKTLMVSVLYWSISVLMAMLLRNKVTNLLGIMQGMAVIFCVLCVAANLTVRQSVTFSNVQLNVKRASALGLCVILAGSYQFMQVDRFLLQPYVSTIQKLDINPDEITYNENDGVYTITTDKDDFKILQLTDIHLGGSSSSVMKDYKALTACYKLFETIQPDFVVVTGDLVFPLGVMSLSLNNTAPITQFAAFMRNVGVPWAFTYGNHDTESVANGSVSEIKALFQSLSFKTSKNLLYPYVQPDITGRNNQLIEIRNGDGSLNQALFLLDSNDYVNGVMNDYDYIHDDQVQWYENHIERLNQQEGKSISSLLFFHMPLQEYRTAFELYEEGSSEITYFYGENKEKAINKICCSEFPSKLFDTAKRLGSTKAMFCGHDHYNNLSIEYKGIRLTYGMSIDYLAMPGIEQDTEQRGGTVITLHKDSAYDIQQVKLSDIE